MTAIGDRMAEKPKSRKGHGSTARKSQDNLKSREDLMHYVESPHRLPYEMASGILQAEIGCSYNRCRFCSLCRKPGKDYRPAPREEVEAELDELASYVRRPSRIYRERLRSRAQVHAQATYRG